MSTQQQGVEPFSYPAGIDMSAVGANNIPTYEYTLVKLNASGQFIPIAAATDPVDGVLQNAPIAGAQARIEWSGILKVKTGAAITVGEMVCARADGTVGPPVTGSTVVGRALEASALAGTIIRVFVKPTQIIVSP